MTTIIRYKAGLRFFFAYDRITKKENLVRIEGEYLNYNYENRI